jgi:hypothetical protein
MQKSKYYEGVKFSIEKLREALKKWQDMLPQDGGMHHPKRTVTTKNETWDHDNDEEFFADFQKEYEYALYRVFYSIQNSPTTYFFWIDSRPTSRTTITIEAPTRAEIESVFNVFEKDWQQFKIELPVVEESPVIFIGHGRSTAWRDLKDHLTDKHNYKIEAFETGARAGHTIRDILDEMLNKSSMALLVLTGEDETVSGGMSARQNVIHETGLFQGKLGFGRAIVLLEEGTSEFSNLHGIQQIRFSKNNIKESFGDVLATIKREFNR